MDTPQRRNFLPALAITSAPGALATDNLLGVPTPRATIHFFENGWEAIASQAVPERAFWLVPNALPDLSAYDCIEVLLHTRPADRFLIYPTSQFAERGESTCQTSRQVSANVMAALTSVGYAPCHRNLSTAISNNTIGESS